MINAITSLFYGLSIALAFILTNFLLWRSAKKEDNISVEVIFDWSLVMTIFAIVGGRLFFILSHFNAFAPDIFRWIHFIRSLSFANLSF
ncbi:prolipoprotein diacylglyceryl transferase [Candidatus Gottesmanbacteria bacterium]|nr:prolipoprotein diacylglyceryl transferase [Candidatus Gottesmanbacteria bacterium]